MKIVRVDYYGICFDNGDAIRDEHYADCCERNYADYKQIEPEALDTEFEYPIKLQVCEYGFRFGNLNGKMFFVPCYSEQNGYYSRMIDVIYSNKNGKIIEKLKTECEWKDC